MNIFSFITSRLHGSQTSMQASVITSAPTLGSLLVRYEQECNRLLTNEQLLLGILLIRDQIQSLMEKGEEVQEAECKKLVDLDEKLRQYGRKHRIIDLSHWRLSLQKTEKDWWWFLDEPVDFPDNNPISEIISATFVVTGGVLFADVIKKTWNISSDPYSIFWAILVLLFTASPFIKRFREVIGFLLKKIRSTNFQQNQIMVILSIVVLTTSIAARFIYLPIRAQGENKNGVQSAADGNLQQAREHLDAAVAIDNQYTAAYYNLANVYEGIGETEKAISLYETVIEQKNSMVPAYINLGRLLIEKEEEKRAIIVLNAGYRSLESAPADKKDELEYKLLSYMGLAYYEQKENIMAEYKFMQAIAVENKLQTELKVALPHYYLALLLEDKGELKEALNNFESSRRYFQQSDPELWDILIDQHLAKLRGIIK